MILFLAATASFAAPQPLNSATWFQGFGAHPKENSLTLIASTITVNPDGRAEACEASTILGETDWAAFTCHLIRERARFRPAMIHDERTFGVYRLRTAWVQRGPAPTDLPVWDFEVPLHDSPADTEFPMVRKIKIAVDAAGKVQGCEASGDWTHPELARTACAQVQQKLRIEPARTRSGDAVHSVQDAAVRFVLSPMAASAPER